MFVEVVRLFIVLLATAAGFAMGKGPEAMDAGNGAILGATLGACIGYVSGGVLGRLLDQGIGLAERRFNRTPAHQLLAGGVGAVVLGGLAGVVLLPAAFVFPPQLGWSAVGLVVWVGAFLGYRVGARKSDELLAMAGLSSRPLLRTTTYGSSETPAVLVDATTVSDGRLLALVRAGFLRDALLVPRFVVDQLEAIADSEDAVRSRRGRRGLEMLEALRLHPDVTLHVLEDELPDQDDAHGKLVALARRSQSSLLTLDETLQRAAELQGVRCLSLRRLGEGMRPVYLPGEAARIAIVREGKEAGQGVGFLDDGTMVVVGGARELMGQEVEVRITSKVETSVGRMLFASVASEPEVPQRVDGAADDGHARRPSP
ncbi:MAG TPA: TRAM domain-containing protein [Acidimicrobiales bacterium]|nr:TRAM domain-containing protein [Acidimicrobiales bacterium]